MKLTDIILIFLWNFLFTIFATHWLISFLKARSIGQKIREEGPRSHLSKQGNPTMGGIVFVAALITTILIFRNIFFEYITLWLVIVAGAITGFMDDWIKVLKHRSLGLRAREKLALQFLFSILLGWWCYSCGYTFTYLPWGGSLELGWTKIILVSLCWVGSLNAVNFTDGLDGLASSTTTVVAIILAGFLYILNPMDNLIGFLFAVVGINLGFLWFNGYPASIFMGDIGSFFLGAALATVVVVRGLELWFIWLGLPFVLEVISVIIQVISFKMTGKRVFRMTPIHHHFEQMGFPEVKIARGFTILTIIIGGVGLYLFLLLK